MAPSRGLHTLLRARLNFSPRENTRRYSDFAQAVSNPLNKSHVYISRSLDPFLNLSIEHYLLQKTPADSTILFLYTNRPSIIIGRNQNPWLEANLGLIRNTDLGVSLVRRRSGGGTVFHDEGNVNYSVICPTAAFTRDKHAEMVVRALKTLGVDMAMVNERHDIVLRYLGEARELQRPLKVSGSAYKVTRLRSLHHGTCLLSSPNLGTISNYLRSPARPFIKGRGVESVSSPITNVDVSSASFEEAVISEFGHLYDDGGKPLVLTESIKEEVPEIAKGVAELTSLDWIYSQTPQFTFSSHKTEDDPRERPPLPQSVLPGFTAKFTVRNGTIADVSISYGGSIPTSEEDRINASLLHSKLHEIDSWEDVLLHHDISDADSTNPGTWMDMLFGTGDYWPS